MTPLLIFACLIVLALGFLVRKTGKSRDLLEKSSRERSLEPSKYPEARERLITSLEIPLPEDFEFKHRSRSRISDRERRLRRERRQRAAEYIKRLRAQEEERRREQAEKLNRLQAQVEERKREQDAELNRAKIRLMRQRNSVGFSTEWLIAQRESQSNECFWCGVPLLSGSIHLDHVHPLSAGGFHDVANLVLSCGACNLRKGVRNPFAFADTDFDKCRSVVVRRRLEALGIASTPAESRRTQVVEPKPELTLDYSTPEHAEVSQSPEYVWPLTIEGEVYQLSLFND